MRIFFIIDNTIIANIFITKMNTNLILSKKTMTYAEYINCFILKRSIKKHLVQLSFPLDEIPHLSTLSEEELF